MVWGRAGDVAVADSLRVCAFFVVDLVVCGTYRSSTASSSSSSSQQTAAAAACAASLSRTVAASR